MQKAVFAKTILAGTGKKGILLPDKNGYYKVTLGAFATENRSGIYYNFNKVLEQLFKPGSSLQRRIDNGVCRGEIQHPPFLPGMTMAQYLNRLREINMLYVSMHVGKVELEEAKDEHGKPMIRVTGWVRPSGTLGSQLKDSLDNREENTCFSIRTICKDTFPQGRHVRDITELVGWDQVHENGMQGSTKLESPGLEGLIQDDSFEITPVLLDQAEVALEGVGLESSMGITTTMIRDDFGWSKTQVIAPNVQSMNW